MKILGVLSSVDSDTPSETTDSLVSYLLETGVERSRIATVSFTGRSGVENSKDDFEGPKHVEIGSEVRITEEKNGFDDVLNSLADRGIEYVLVDGSVEDFGDVEDIPLVGVNESDVEGCVAQVSNPPTEDELEKIFDKLDDFEEYETLKSLVEKAKEHPDSTKAGAVATFTGRVRAENHDEAETTHLEFEKYGDVAESKMEEIREDLKEREGVYEVLLYHRTGVIEAEEDIVHVVVLAGHRTEAFETVEDGINRLKDEVPIFKKEVTEEGDYWVHNRP